MNPPACERCHGTVFSQIMDSLAVYCVECGFVWVEGAGPNSWDRGATIQEWAKDLAESDKKRNG